MYMLECMSIDTLLEKRKQLEIKRMQALNEVEVKLIDAKLEEIKKAPTINGFNL